MGPASYAVGSQTNDLYTGDFNGDGFKDVILADNITNQIYTFINAGTGAFGAGNAMFNGGTRPTALTTHGRVITGNFNGDAFLDIIYLADGGGNTFAVGLGAGTGVDTTAGTVDDFNVESGVLFSGNTPLQPLQNLI